MSSSPITLGYSKPKCMCSPDHAHHIWTWKHRKSIDGQVGFKYYKVNLITSFHCLKPSTIYPLVPSAKQQQKPQLIIAHLGALHGPREPVLAHLSNLIFYCAPLAESTTTILALYTLIFENAWKFPSQGLSLYTHYSFAWNTLRMADFFSSFTSNVASSRSPLRINLYDISSVITIYTITVSFASYHLSLILSSLVFFFFCLLIACIPSLKSGEGP